MIDFLQSDVLEATPTGLFHACLCDPPYGLGFMGKHWDHGVPGVDYWRSVSDWLLPGAHLLAFGGTRTFHRLACAIEDAGFEIRDTVMWVYGSGFPKSLDVSKAIDKAAGAERDVIGVNNEWIKRVGNNHGKSNTYTDKCHGSVGPNGGKITAPATPAAISWQGYGTALKPAWEPVIIARKPPDGTVAANVMRYGAGGLNIDGCRVGDNPGYKYRADANGTTFHGQQGERIKQTAAKKGAGFIESSKGRWPANVIHDGSSEVLAGFPVTGGAKQERVGKRGGSGFGFLDDEKSASRQGLWPADAGGSAARFFYCAKAGQSERNKGLDKCESIMVETWRTSNEGDLPWENADHIVRLLVDTEPSPPKVIGVSGAQNNDVTAWNTMMFGKNATGQSLLDSSSIIETVTKSTIESKILSLFRALLTSASAPDASCATVNGGSRVKSAELGILRLVTTSDMMESLLGAGSAASPMRLQISASEGCSGHPTVKPLALCRYLATLILPPPVAAPRRIVVPFAGSGSEAIGAMLAGWDEVVGVEREAEYIEIAKRRAAYWAGAREPEQGELFTSVPRETVDIGVDGGGQEAKDTIEIDSQGG